MTKYILYCSLASIVLFSCKKYDENKSYSSYTAMGRLCKKGNWQIEEVTNLSSGQTDKNISLFDFSFNSDIFNWPVDTPTYILSNKKENVSVSLCLQYSNVLKPVLIELMEVQTDLILIGSATYDSKTFNFTNNKNKLNMTEFISFGYMQNNTFKIRKSIDVEFDIERLELGHLQLNYQDKLKIIMKKVPE
jgi:hypothetical protein